MYNVLTHIIHILEMIIKIISQDVATPKEIRELTVAIHNLKKAKEDIYRND